MANAVIDKKKKKPTRRKKIWVFLIFLIKRKSLNNRSVHVGKTCAYHHRPSLSPSVIVVRHGLLCERFRIVSRTLRFHRYRAFLVFLRAPTADNVRFACRSTVYGYTPRWRGARRTPRN